MADDTTQQRTIGATVPPVRGRPEPGPTATADDAGAPDMPATRRRERRRDPIVQVAAREAGEVSRTSPRMRLDLLQLGAVAVGLGLVVASLVALARTGFDELGAFEPVVEVGGQAATPLYAVLWLLIGAVVLAAGTGSVDERRLRVLGVLLGVLGAVLLIEPDAFRDYLGVTADSGRILLVLGAVLTATSFVPPLSVARPGMARD